jgi:hypothetical protein
VPPLARRGLRRGPRIEARAGERRSLYDSWLVPAPGSSARNRNTRNNAPEELVDQRRQALHKATARELSEAEEEEYLSPWHTEDATRSWTAMAQAADARYTQEVVEPLKEMGLPTASMGRGRQVPTYQLRAALRTRDAPRSPCCGARCAPHPEEDDPEGTGNLLANFFAGNSA